MLINEKISRPHSLLLKLFLSRASRCCRVCVQIKSDAMGMGSGLDTKVAATVTEVRA
jgi:hypothetical protein